MAKELVSGRGDKDRISISGSHMRYCFPPFLSLSRNVPENAYVASTKLAM